MKELDSWLKVFGIVTDSARKNVLITFITIVLIIFIASVALTIRVVIISGRDKDKLYDRIIEEVKREQMPIMYKMEDASDQTNKQVEQTLLKADSILESLREVSKNKTK